MDAKQSLKYSVLGVLLGFSPVLTMLATPLALLFTFLGLITGINHRKEKNSWMAITAIILSSFYFALTIFLLAATLLAPYMK